MNRTEKQRLEQLVRQGLVPSAKLQVLMRAIAKSRLGTLLTPEERSIMFTYMDKLQHFVLGDEGVFNRARNFNRQTSKYQTEESIVEIDENVRIVDGPEEEEKMRASAERKAKKLSVRKRDKYRLLTPELKREKKKSGMDEEVMNFHQLYKENFEAALEFYGVENIRDLPEDKKVEFFAVVDEALEEAKMAKKDYDGDGKVETSTAEYMGSRDKAIKKAMKKEELEQVDELKKSTLSSYIQKAADPAKKKSNVNLASKAAHKLATSDNMNAGEKEDRKAFMRSKGIQTAAKKLAKEGYYKDIDTNKKEDERLAKQKADVKKVKEEMTPQQKADRMKIIARAADRVQSGAAAKDAEKRAKADMKQKGAQKGMAPTKKDVEEQIQELRTMIREGNDKIAAYKLLSQILNNKENLGE